HREKGSQFRMRVADQTTAEPASAKSALLTAHHPPGCYRRVTARGTAGRTSGMEGSDMNPQLFTAFVLITLVLIVTPGPIVTLVIATGATRGTRAALTTVGGTTVGNAILLA